MDFLLGYHKINYTNIYEDGINNNFTKNVIKP